MSSTEIKTSNASAEVGIMSLLLPEDCTLGLNLEALV
jgi:hypothetical protein